MGSNERTERTNTDRSTVMLVGIWNILEYVCSIIIYFIVSKMYWKVRCKLLYKINVPSIRVQIALCITEANITV